MIDGPPPLASRRRFLSKAIGAVLPLHAASKISSADELKTVSIFYTTDLHGHILPTVSYGGWEDVGGFARCASQIRKWRRDNPDSLLIDVGDLYQGTHVSKSSGSTLMIDLLEKLDYDAWVIGNHEFDWGLEPLSKAVQASTMPVLSANALLGDRPAWLDNRGHPLRNVLPYILKEVGGFKIAVVGATTPGLPFWLHPQLLEDFSASPPAAAVKRAVADARAAGAHAVIVAGHMGLKQSEDDYANPVREVVQASEPDVYIAGHTHKDMPSVPLGKVLYTQAGYHGLHAGRLDLAFSRSTGKLVDKRAFTVLMDRRFDLDPVVLDRSKEALARSQRALASSVGRLGEEVTSEQADRCSPSAAHRLIGSAIKSALSSRQIEIDAVFHGVFSGDPLPAGPVTLEDLWRFIPYENMVVTARITVRELKEILTEDLSIPFSKRTLMGSVRVTASEDRKSVSLSDHAGNPLNGDHRLEVAMNSYDARSGGHRLMKLRNSLERPESNASFHRVETREALILYLQGKESLNTSDFI